VSLWRGNKEDSLINGKIIEPKNKAFPPHYKFLPIELTPFERTHVFVKVENFAWKNSRCKVELLTQNGMHNKLWRIGYEERLDIYWGVATFGITFFLFLYTLLQYIQNQERVYLYYCLYLLSFSLYFLNTLEVGESITLWISYWGMGYFFWEIVLNHVPLIFYALFVQEFFHTKDKDPTLHRVLTYLSLIVLGLLSVELILWTFGYHDFVRAILFFTRILIFISSICILIFMHQRLRQNPFAQYIILGSLLALIGSTFTLLIGLIKLVWGFNLISNLLQPTRISVLLEILLFSFTLGLRSKQIENELIEKELAQKELESELLNTEIKALKAQINPHFVSNCLNSVKKLIQEGQMDKAISYLVSFSSFIQKIVGYSLESTVSLEEEIEASERYLEIEKMAMGPNFSYAFTLPDNPNSLDFVQVPPFSLQPFLENAVRYAFPHYEGREKWINILLEDTGESVRCTIEDNGIGINAARLLQKRKVLKESTGIGIPNVHERFRLANIIQETDMSVRVLDKSDLEEEFSGTLVILEFPY
ncbi:MAG: histidine kinase, partial [Bacteroidota bacterium]